MTIPLSNVIAGALIDPVWGNSVVDAINEEVSVVERGTYTPTATNLNIGSGGSAANTARYTYIGGRATGQYGVLQISHNVTLGTSGFSVGTAPTFSLPAGFEIDLVSLSATLKLGLVALAGAPGVAQYASATTWGYTVLNYSGTYGTFQAITASVPSVWASGDFMRGALTVGVQRV